VPEETNRITSAPGTHEVTFSASSTSSAQGAPNEVPLRMVRATASSTEDVHDPNQRPPGVAEVEIAVPVFIIKVGALSARMNKGVPPTALKARTGEFTPPARTRLARCTTFPKRPS